MLNKNRFYELTDSAIFKGCSDEDINRLILNVPNRLTSYKRGDIIAQQGAPCMSLLFLCQGKVSAQMSGIDGKEIVIERLKAPEILAFAFIYGTENYFPVSIIAASDCKIWSIDRSEFINVMHSSRRIMMNVLQNISDRTQFLSRKINEFALQSLSERIISYLKRHRSIENQQEVAFILGVARPSLSRALSVLSDEGRIIKIDKAFYLSK